MIDKLCRLAHCRRSLAKLQKPRILPTFPLNASLAKRGEWKCRRQFTAEGLVVVGIFGRVTRRI
jgi:hypothetical protein